MPGFLPATDRLRFEFSPRTYLIVFAAGFLLLPVGHCHGAEEPDGVEFFEKRIRPLLVEHCYECHGGVGNNLKGGLRLDSRDGLRQGGDSGPAIGPGARAKSLLLQTVRTASENLQTPSKHRLEAAQIADLEKWIALGAPDPRTDIPPSTSPRVPQTHWSFQPLTDPQPPPVKNTRWPQTDVDFFILARLEAFGLAPRMAADKRALLRRATFDLTGLPTTLAEAETFLRDSSSDAFEKVIERLLASPHYGERWGRHWLDLVRYADTAGESADYPIPQAWRYRNYVIESFNRDKPYNQFVREQIAGDLLPSANESEARAHIIATGFIACARRFGVVTDETRHLTIEDTLDTMGRVFLGLSLSCARCHDHKYDPISTRDYYALYGIFSSTRYAHPGSEVKQHQEDFVPLIPRSEVAALTQPHQEKLAALDAERARVTKKLELMEREGFKTDDLRESLEALNAKRSLLVAAAPVIETAYAVADGKPADARVQLRGDPLQPGEEVPRGFLKILGGQRLPNDESGSGRRELAEWVTSTNNPLFARVMVNRIWQHHFGRGIVATPSDFGRRGHAPTHPALLDYLASRFIESGWSVKEMHRLIMLSATYQQASQYSAISNQFSIFSSVSRWADTSAVTMNIDSLNADYFSPFPRRRLDAEEIRDTLLVLSGDLDPTPGGPHPFPPEKEWDYTQHAAFTAVYETNKRSVYLMQQRIKRHPFLALFDGADPNTSMAERGASITPLQALFALNDKFVHEQAGKFAERLLRERSDERKRIDLAHQLAFGRPGRPDEMREAAAYLARFREKLKTTNVPVEKCELTAWASYARALLGSNEFMFVD